MRATFNKSGSTFATARILNLDHRLRCRRARMLSLGALPQLQPSSVQCSVSSAASALDCNGAFPILERLQLSQTSAQLELICAKHAPIAQRAPFARLSSSWDPSQRFALLYVGTNELASWPFARNAIVRLSRRYSRENARSALLGTHPFYLLARLT